MRMARFSSTTWRPVSPAGDGPGRGRRGTWPSVRTGPRSRSFTTTRKTRPARIIEAESGRLVRSIALPSGGAGNVAWSPDGRTLATACDDRKIYLWDAATGIRRATLEGHPSSGLSATFHPAGTLLASDGWEGRLRLWDPVLGRSWLNLTAGIRSEFSQDGRIVLTREDP